MSCRGDHKGENCVCDIVRNIADAQNDVFENCCDVSCEQSINDLLSPAAANDLDTVPFMLYCEGDCKPFKASGVTVDNGGGSPSFDCIESFLFRVKSVDDDCCAVLELLSFEGDPAGAGNQGSECLKDPCHQFDGQSVADLTATGICITVDLDCFCAIHCFPAVNLF